jgi:hypothetical protein
MANSEPHSDPASSVCFAVLGTSMTENHMDISKKCSHRCLHYPKTKLLSAEWLNRNQAMYYRMYALYLRLLLIPPLLWPVGLTMRE